MEQIITDDQNTARQTVVVNAHEYASVKMYQSALTANCYEINEGDSSPRYIIPSVESA
jgi:hypothetical protein